MMVLTEGNKVGRALSLLFLVVSFFAFSKISCVESVYDFGTPLEASASKTCGICQEDRTASNPVLSFCGNNKHGFHFTCIKSYYDQALRDHFRVKFQCDCPFRCGKNITDYLGSVSATILYREEMRRQEEERRRQARANNDDLNNLSGWLSRNKIFVGVLAVAAIGLVVLKQHHQKSTNSSQEVQKADKEEDDFELDDEEEDFDDSFFDELDEDIHT